MNGKKVMKKGAGVRLILWTVAITLAVLPIVYRFGVLEMKDLWDFLSYELPCAAGVCAGAGLFFDRQRAKKAASGTDGDTASLNEEKNGSLDRFFYLGSVVFLLAGLVFYMFAHRCTTPAVLVVLIAALIVIIIFLASRVVSDMSNNAWIGGGGGPYHRGFGFWNSASRTILGFVLFLGRRSALLPQLGLSVGHEQGRDRYEQHGC